MRRTLLATIALVALPVLASPVADDRATKDDYSLDTTGSATSLKAKGGGISLGSSMFGGNSGVGMSGNTAVVEISLRLIDATTGQVISTSKAEGSASSKEFNATLYERDGWRRDTAFLHYEYELPKGGG